MLLSLVAVLACGAEIVDKGAVGGAGGEGGGNQGGENADGDSEGGAPVKLEDRCEAIEPDFETKERWEASCCDAGCAPVILPPSHPGGTCVDISRHCRYENMWLEPCPPGYECIMGYGVESMDPCNLEELGVGHHGYCFWKGDER